MYFASEPDGGDRIAGWVTPDNPSAIPEVAVYFDGARVAEVVASTFWPDLRDTGLHTTGQCGYVIDEQNAPGLGAQAAVELYAEGLLIFRRLQPAHLPQKLFRFETRFLGEKQLDALLRERFQMAYGQIEFLGEETVGWLSRLPSSESIYVTGRVQVRRWEGVFRDRGFFMSAVLRDPAEELAEQLLFLTLASKKPELVASMRLSEGRRSVVEALAGKPWSKPEELAVVLRGLEGKARAALSNPLTMMLAAQSPDEEPGPHLVGDALKALAGFHAVGLRTELGDFIDTLSAVLDTDPLPRVDQPSYSSVSELADAIRDQPAAQRLIGLDLELYEAVREAYSTLAVETG